METFERSQEISNDVKKNIETSPGGYRILTGERPTGSLHIGHYFGSLLNRIQLQRKGVELFILIANQQVLTDHDSFDNISQLMMELTIDNISAGIDFDNDKTFIFPHSHVPELNQLIIPFLTLVSIAELERNPTVKDEIQSAHLKSINAGMLVYPVHQAADILSVNANLVPVGKDQLPHIELTRVIAKRFNSRFCADNPVFKEPVALLSETPHIVGLDGKQKMSKSRSNSIMLKSTKDEIAEAVRKAVTDGDRFITFDPQNRPEVSNLLTLVALMSYDKPENIAKSIGDGGAKMLKEMLIDVTDKFLNPIRKKRKELEKDEKYIRNIIHRGIERARYEANITLQKVLKVMNMLV
ncbi:MAG: tryptophan--tRNA ligase [Rickettsiales bacterium]|jgi:tryptophanyl-tRNA synthetase|nr:tryptophan--tRNA ligase [Rickettsiales bacterium]